MFGEDLERSVEFQADNAFGVAARLADDRVSAPGAAPEVFDIGVLGLGEDIVGEQGDRGVMCAVLDADVQVKKPESLLNRLGIPVR